MSAPVVRRLTPDDERKLAELCEAFVPRARAYARFELAHPETFRWFGALDGASRLIGVQRVIHWPDAAFLRTVFVRKAARGDGLGTHLIATAVRDAEAAGKQQVLCWSWDVGREREMLSRKLRLRPCPRRYIRFRVPARRATSGVLSTRRAQGSDLALLRRLRAADDVEMKVPRAGALGREGARAGYAVLEDDRVSVRGGFFFACEQTCISIVCPILAHGLDVVDLAAAGAAWAEREGFSLVDLPVPHHDVMAWFRLRELGAQCLHARPVGLSRRELQPSGARTGG